MKILLSEERSLILMILIELLNPICFTALTNIRRHTKPITGIGKLEDYVHSSKKLVPFAMDKRRGSGPREYEFPSLNECKLFFADKYSLDNDVFEIN